MPKGLIIDLDKGLKSLGSDSAIEKTFGYKPRRYTKTGEFNKLLKSVFIPKTIKSTDEFGEVTEQTYITEKDVDFIYVDTLNELMRMKKNEVKGKANAVTINQWGEIGDYVENLITMFRDFNKTVIITAHIKEEKDDDLGILIHHPALSGRMKNEAGRYFDCIFFTAIHEDSKGKKEYLWKVEGDERRAAGSRIQSVVNLAKKNDGYLQQDFEAIFEAANKEGHQHLKILILGQPKTGKTRSLATMENVKFEEQSKQLKSNSKIK